MKHSIDWLQITTLSEVHSIANKSTKGISSSQQLPKLRLSGISLIRRATSSSQTITEQQPKQLYKRAGTTARSYERNSRELEHHHSTKLSLFYIQSPQSRI
jgi:hypothetical protein